MKLSNALDILDRLLMEKQSKKLQRIEREILAVAWANGSYREIVDYQEQTVKNHAVRLWKYLSQVFNTKVNKSNIRQLIENLAFEPMTEIESGNRVRFFGRMTELCQLQSLILPTQDAATKASRAKLTFLYGMRGMGKTSLAQKLAENLSSQVDCWDTQQAIRVVWIDLATAPPLPTFLWSIINELDGGRKAKLSPNLATAITKTIGYLQQQRCLLILDNADPIFSSIDLAPAYIQFLDRLNTAEHHSFCLTITAAAPTQIDASYHKLELRGLDRESCQSLLEHSELVGTFTEWDRLIHKYHGNPHYLKLVSSTIRDIFNRSISKFLAANIIVYDRVEIFLAQQIDLLTHTELAVIIWLAIEGKPMTLDLLRSKFDQSVIDRELVRILDRLVNQYLIEVKDDNFTLSELVMEYISEHYQDLIVEEIWVKKPEHLDIYPILPNSLNPQIDQIERRSILDQIVTKLLQRKINSQTRLKSIRSLLFGDRQLVDFKHDLIIELTEFLPKLDVLKHHNICTPRNESSKMTNYAFDNINNLLEVLKA